MIRINAVSHGTISHNSNEVSFHADFQICFLQYLFAKPSSLRNLDCKITHFVHKRILKNIQMFYMISLLLKLWYFSSGHGKSFVVKKYRSL